MAERFEDRLCCDDGWDWIKGRIYCPACLKRAGGKRPLTERAGELARLEDGWFDGKGTAPDRKCLAELVGILSDCCDAEDPPKMFPIPAGGVQIEWPEGELTVTFPSMEAQMMFENGREIALDLRNKEDLKKLKVPDAEKKDTAGN